MAPNKRVKDDKSKVLLFNFIISVFFTKNDHSWLLVRGEERKRTKVSSIEEIKRTRISSSEQ